MPMNGEIVAALTNWDGMAVAVVVLFAYAARRVARRRRASGQGLPCDDAPGAHRAL